jgi:spermidine/putrescine transport system ATP-binding protein
MTPDTPPLLRFDDLCKAWGERRILDHFSLQVRDGEFITLLGPSGCGKTTLLRLLGGFETADAGRILLGGEDITRLPPHQRPVNTVFQNYALFPHMNVFDNVAYGLRMEGRPRDEIAQRVRDALSMVRLDGFAERRPHQLSGGQQQRVAIARAVVKKPRVLLLDEPLSALDYKLRRDMQIELKRLQRELGITFLFVTHDQEEALSMSDRIVVMREGHVEQIGTPRDVYETPASLFVARFVGEANLFRGEALAQEGDETLRASVEGREILLRPRGRQFAPGAKLRVMLRPEDLRLSDPALGGAGWRGRVVERNYRGMTLETLIRLDGGLDVLASEFFDESHPDFDYGLGEPVLVNWVPDWEWVLPDDEG